MQRTAKCLLNNVFIRMPTAQNAGVKNAFCTNIKHALNVCGVSGKSIINGKNYIIFKRTEFGCALFVDKI